MDHQHFTAQCPELWRGIGFTEISTCPHGKISVLRSGHFGTLATMSVPVEAAHHAQSEF
jgi:hypothetical protein